jgi:hypothetical protein
VLVLTFRELNCGTWSVHSPGKLFVFPLLFLCFLPREDLHSTRHAPIKVRHLEARALSRGASVLTMSGPITTALAICGPELLVLFASANGHYGQPGHLRLP